MDMVLQVKLLQPFSQDDQDTLAACTASSEFPAEIGLALVEPRRPRIGFTSIDPTVIDLVCKIGGGAAAGAVVTGMFACISEWLRGRAQMVTVKIGEVSIAAPPTMIGTDLGTFTEKVAAVARAHEEKPKVSPALASVPKAARQRKGGKT